MIKYDYYKNMLEDVAQYFRWNEERLLSECSDLEELREKMNDECWIDDSVTGNASGSYTFNGYLAEEYIAGNWDLLAEAVEEFGCNDVSILAKGAEWCDVTIRCYLLPQVIDDFISSREFDFDNRG